MTERPRAVELLRLLLVGTLVVPALLLVVIAWITNRTAFIDARHELSWTSEVAREHASKVFDSYGLVADRVSDLLGSLSAEEVRSSEERLRQVFRAIVSGLPQIESLIVLDRTGHLLVATDSYPVDRSIDFSDRDYFQALRATGVTTFISRVQTSRITGRTFFGWGRSRRGSDGAFDGVIDIALSPRFLETFYSTLLSEVGQSVDGRMVSIVRADGQVLARQPGLAGPPPVVPSDNPFFTAVRANPDGGTYVSRSLVDPGAPKRLYAYRKVPAHPVYTVAGRSVSAIQREWALGMLRYVAFGIPATAVLFLVVRAALMGARREREALSLARAEMARRELAEESMRQSQKMEAVGQLTGGIAHDFNNLLTIIRTSVDLLRRPDLPDERRRRYMDSVSETVDRGAKLTGQLLAFARRQALKPEVFDVGPKLRGFAGVVETIAGPRIRVTFEVSDEPCMVRADLGQFETALVNMAVNARDAMEGQGSLTLGLERGQAMPPIRGHPGVAGSFVAVSLADTGSGIAADRIVRIFEPFFTTKEVGKGTGLGLSQVFGFVKQSGGDVAVESEVGRGTRFTLFLPEVEGEAERGREIEAHLEAPFQGGGQRVLVVEDDAEVGRFSTQILHDLGYRTTWAANAEEALRLFGPDGAAFDIVFSDVVMPGMNGVALAHDVRRRVPDMPVVLASGYSDVLVESGPHGFELLQKPYAADELSRILRRVASGRGVKGETAA